MNRATASIGSSLRSIRFAVFGALSGVVVASACVLLRLGEPSSVEIAGYCLGVRPSSYSHCQTIDGAFYLFPGLIFGLVFAPLLVWRGELEAHGAAGYAAAATIANAAAVFLCVSLMHPLDDVLPVDNPLLDLAVSGVIAGAAGALLLGAARAALKPGTWRGLPVAVAATLGGLAPIMLMFDSAGIFAFYIIWQGSYAAALGFSAAAGGAAATSPTA